MSTIKSIVTHRHAASRLGLLLTVSTFLALATAWNLLIPPYENLDELEHSEVVRYVATTGRLPVHDDADTDGYRVRQEASQPPLYYLVAAGVLRILDLPLTPPVAEDVPSSLVACGLTGTLYNKATWIHNPLADGFPWTESLLRLHSLRLLSTLLQVTTLLGVWTLAWRIHPSGHVPLLATGIVAFNPQLLLLAAGVNNDNAVIPLATWGLVLAYDLWSRGPERWRSLAFGIVCGLAGLSKLSGLALLSLGGLALLARLLQRESTLREFIVHGLITVTSAAAVLAPWVLRNLQLYGDPTALAPMLARVGLRVTPMGWGEARLMALSYWGQLPCAFYPRALYWPYLALVVGGVVGVLVAWRYDSVPQKRAYILCAIWFSVITLAWVRWNNTTPAPGGRLLFPAIAALAIPIASGWHGLDRHLTRAWGVLMPIWALVVLTTGPIAMMAAPPFQTEAISIPNPMEATFRDSIALRGYEATIRDPNAQCVLLSSEYCGPALDITVFWEALAQVEEDLTMVVQLVSPAPGATDLRLNYNYWPGHGNLRTSTWPTDRLIRDRYLLPLPERDGETQAWDLLLAFTNPDTGRREPVTLSGDEAGDALVLTRLRVPDLQPRDRLDGGPAVRATLTDAIVLLDAAVIRREDTWEIRLLWESRRPADLDLITFVHAYSGAGELVATGDGPPRGGTFPISLWEPGDRVVSVHSFVAPLEPSISRIAVGLYDPGTGKRLSASRDGTPLPDDAILIWERDS